MPKTEPQGVLTQGKNWWQQQSEENNVIVLQSRSDDLKNGIIELTLFQADKVKGNLTWSKYTKSIQSS